MGEPRTGAPLDDGGGWTGSEEGSEEGTGGSEGVGGDGGPDAEGVWSPDIEQSFQEALAIYPPCGRRKIILSDEGKMYGRNELIARYIKLRTGKTRTRKQDQVSKDKAFQTMATMSSAQLISAPSLQAKLGPSGPQVAWAGTYGDLGSWQARALGTARLQLVEFSAFVEPPDAVDSFQRHLFVHISQQCPSPGAPPLESVDVRQIYDKFPEKKGGLRELYDRGPPHAFFLVKFWADLNWGPSGEQAGTSGGSGGFYGVSSQYESRELMTLTCSSKVCSFGKQVVEKVETERAQLEDGRFVYRLLRSPMCEYLVNFLHKLRQLPERYMMNSVLENFTILQVVTNRDTQELLLCTAYVFEVSTSERGAQHHIYRLVRD
ncbi:Transcriptional enhancer factor TEF-4 [Cricetulus griseus]|uniref:Transcriptional enhancer factor TEF-4 n=1 Tax=Cricetulus griseus TaxID=10029 RepID=G3HZZ5_CRIGR|nr:Transcriptional enhancer factor TEF-4 [Cricetulus griseus]ERE70091.1 transcriptional enhancer factor TEF-4 [Cricetulus griseus]